MALTEEYTCKKCGNKLVNNDNLFFYDSELKATIVYPLLFSTASRGADSLIKGDVSETYCQNCKKFVRIYIITTNKNNIENVHEIVKQGINNNIDKKLMAINELKEIKKREKYIVEKKKEKIMSKVAHETSYIVIFPELNNGFTYYGDSGLNEHEVIEKAIDSFHEQVDYILDFYIKDYKKDIKANYFVLDASNNLSESYNLLDNLNCPKCHAKIDYEINEKTPCPKCGGKLSLTNTIDSH